eukprot:364561-Chlamydomonas_euryale.AAC.2
MPRKGVRVATVPCNAARVATVPAKAVRVATMPGWGCAPQGMLLSIHGQRRALSHRKGSWLRGRLGRPNPSPCYGHMRRQHARQETSSVQTRDQASILCPNTRSGLYSLSKHEIRPLSSGSNSHLTHVLCVRDVLVHEPSRATTDISVHCRPTDSYASGSSGPPGCDAAPPHLDMQVGHQVHLDAMPPPHI